MRPRQRRMAETRIRGSLTSVLRGAKATRPALTRCELVHLDEPHGSDGHDDELRDPHPGDDLEGLAPVGVEEHDADLPPVSRVDQAWRVDHSDAVPRGEPGARLHEPRIPVRDLDRDA